MHCLPARSLAPLAVAVLVGGMLAACTDGASASAGGSTPGSIATPEQAVARVIAAHPEFDGILPFDQDRIGGCCWYRASAVEGGYEVVFRIGWGDCPSGCIDEHLWTYRVVADGTVELVAESGDSIPPGGIPRDGA